MLGSVDWLHLWKILVGQGLAHNSWVACCNSRELVLNPSFVIWLLKVRNLLCWRDQRAPKPLVTTFQWVVSAKALHKAVVPRFILIYICQQQWQWQHDRVHSHWLQHGASRCHGTGLHADICSSGGGSTAGGAQEGPLWWLCMPSCQWWGLTWGHAGRHNIRHVCAVYAYSYRQWRPLGVRVGLLFSMNNFTLEAVLIQGQGTGGGGVGWGWPHRLYAS